MNIKEVETLTGITKQNIRFYEKKGLLSPQRNQENSYREYSFNDVETLMQIKLLRKLDVSIENIHEILNGADMNAILSQHLNLLLEKQSDLDDIIKMCRFLLHTKKNPPDTRTALQKIEELEQKGGRFMTILNDYKKIFNAGKKLTFEFMPDKLVHTPEDFTKALCEYGMEHDLNLVVTEPGMYPKFELDGLEYQAARHTGRYGHVIYCQLTDPELLQQECKEIATGHKHILSCIYSGIKILTIPVFLLIILSAANPVLAVTAFLFFLLIEIICFLLERKKENI